LAPGFVKLQTLKKKKKQSGQVLVMRLSSMGDVVMATAALAPLKAAGLKISFVTKRAFAPLLLGHPDLHYVYVFDKKEGEAAAREQFFQWYQGQQFDFVLDLQDSWRTWSWRGRLRRHARVVVARKERLREWLILFGRLGRWFGFGRGGRARKFRRAAEDLLSAAGKFPVVSGPLTSLAVTEAEKQSVKGLIPQGEFAAFLPGSAWKGKEWPYFPELAGVVARKVPIVALGAEKDLACDEIALQGRAIGSVSLRGRTNLRQSMAVVAQAKWVIGNETGMLHVAEALGRDVAMLEGPTHSYLGFSPYRPRSLLLGLDLFCRPCSKSGRFCPRFGKRKCMAGLSVQAVTEKLRAWGLPC